LGSFSDGSGGVKLFGCSCGKINGEDPRGGKVETWSHNIVREEWRRSLCASRLV